MKYLRRFLAATFIVGLVAHFTLAWQTRHLRTWGGPVTIRRRD